ncbi:hypothetical protein QTP88_010319 [Uroleucon formosanum]
MYLRNQRVDIGLNVSNNKQIAENRQIVLTIFKAVLFLAIQNLAFRGHQEDNLSSNRGNFLEIIHLLGDYNPYLSTHLLNIAASSKKNRITYLSNNTQNKMLLILSNIVREKIINDINGSGLFSIIIDTTTDLTHLEQLAFVVRYVMDNGDIQERLLSVEVANDATGKGLFGLFCSICEKYNLNWKKKLCAQVFDGASSMQGKYYGLKSYNVNLSIVVAQVYHRLHFRGYVLIPTFKFCTYPPLYVICKVLLESKLFYKSPCTSAKYIFEAIDKFFTEHGIRWEKCVGITTDGAAAMSGYKTGLLGRVKEVAPQVKWIHCYIHRKALVAKRLLEHMKATLEELVKIINFIKSQPLQSRLFEVLCKDMGRTIKMFAIWVIRVEKNFISNFLTLQAFLESLCECLSQERLKIEYLIQVSVYDKSWIVKLFFESLSSNQWTADAFKDAGRGSGVTKLVPVWPNWFLFEKGISLS